MDEATTQHFFDTYDTLQRLRDGDITDLKQFALQHPELTQIEVRHLVENTIRANLAFDNWERDLSTKKRKIILGTPAHRRFKAVQELDIGCHVHDWLQESLEVARAHPVIHNLLSAQSDAMRSILEPKLLRALIESNQDAEELQRRIDAGELSSAS